MTSEWKKYALAEIAQIQGGGTPSRKIPEYFGGEIPWVTPKDLPAIGIVNTLDKTQERITKNGLEKSSAKLITPGSVLFSSRASIGKIAVTDKPCTTNQGFVNFTPKPNLVDPWFLAFLLCRETAAIVALAGKTTFLEVSRKRLASFRVKIPSIDEQRQIVVRIRGLLDRVDEAEKLRAKSKEETQIFLRAYYRDLYEEMVSRKPTRPLSDFGNVVGGGTPSKKRPEFWDGNIPWVSPKEMKVRDIHETSLAITDAAVTGSSVKLIQTPSVLFVVRGMILAHTLPVAVNRVPVTLNQDMKSITPHERVNVDFLATMLRGAERRLLGAIDIAGHGTRRLKTEIWSAIPIPDLDLAAQLEVVESTAEMEALSDQLVDNITGEELFSLRNSILHKAFSDEL